MKGNEKAIDVNHRFLSYRFSHGGIYEGEFADAKVKTTQSHSISHTILQMNGKGIFVFPNGSSYEGDWKDGKLYCCLF